MTTYTTSDGRWTYGTGEYDKKISDYLGVNAPGPASTVTDKLAEFFFPATKVVNYASLKYQAIAGITIPVFYIWAKGPDGVKRIAEWPFAMHMRDAAFSPFSVTMNGVGTNDLARVSALSNLKSTAGTPSLSTLAKMVAAEKQFLVFNEAEQRVRNVASAEAGGTVLVLLVAAALGLFIVSR